MTIAVGAGLFAILLVGIALASAKRRAHPRAQVQPARTTRVWSILSRFSAFEPRGRATEKGRATWRASSACREAGTPQDGDPDAPHLRPKDGSHPSSFYDSTL